MSVRRINAAFYEHVVASYLSFFWSIIAVFYSSYLFLHIGSSREWPSEMTAHLLAGVALAIIPTVTIFSFGLLIAVFTERIVQKYIPDTIISATNLRHACRTIFSKSPKELRSFTDIINSRYINIDRLLSTDFISDIALRNALSHEIIEYAKFLDDNWTGYQHNSFYAFNSVHSADSRAAFKTLVSISTMVLRPTIETTECAKEVLPIIQNGILTNTLHLSVAEISNRWPNLTPTNRPTIEQFTARIKSYQVALSTIVVSITAIICLPSVVISGLRGLINNTLGLLSILSSR